METTWSRNKMVFLQSTSAFSRKDSSDSKHQSSKRPSLDGKKERLAWKQTSWRDVCAWWLVLSGLEIKKKKKTILVEVKVPLYIF